MAAANKGTKPKVGGVRFAASQPEEGAHSHVHFDEKLHDSVVMVTQEKDGNFLVKVGFLKILHKYEITFLLPPIQRLGKDVCAIPLPNLNLKVISITPVAEGYSVKCEYTAHKEGVLKEEMVLSSETHEDACVKVVVQARVMDRHHGTPMLLEGVRLKLISSSHVVVSKFDFLGKAAAGASAEQPPELHFNFLEQTLLHGALSDQPHPGPNNLSDPKLR
ncbi:unnamed protein product [Caretta caretta]